MTAKRAPKQKYEFWKKRQGDQMTVSTDQERRYVMSAFANWKRGRPGDLRANSKRDGDRYLITFSGISPAEAVAASLASK